jgi:two-component system, OmpR family, sensor histidine kinase ChvG
MSLRKQLLIFGLLTLVLPWAAYRYVQEFEQVLRAGLERALLERAGTVAAALTRQELLVPESHLNAGAGLPIYAPLRAATPPTIDGSRDWSFATGGGLELGGGARLTSGVDDRFVYFALDVPDTSIVYQRRPGEAPYGDRVVVLLAPPGLPRQWLLLTTAAPGSVRAQQTAPPLFVPNAVFDDRIEAVWRESAGAYSVQFRLPISVVGNEFAVGIIDVDEGGAGFEVQMHATWDAQALTPGAFIRERTDVQRAIAQFLRPGDRFRVLDEGGWVIADAGALAAAARFAAPPRSLGEALIRRILRRDDPSYETLELPRGRIADPALRRVLEGQQVAAWFRGSAEREAVVAAAVPLASADDVVGALELEQASDAILTATDQALLRLMAITFGAALLLMLGMLAFATVLSYRVGRLARAAERALTPKGEISTVLPGMRAGDEIGDLSRSFARLLERLREYTQYLRTLTGKLSHELRTPLAVVSTSLENLESEQPRSSPYLERLRQGVVRLDAILAAMSEATHIEQAIESTAVERFDLDALVSASAAAYRDVYPDREFTHRGIGGPAPVDGSPDLVSQMLDKLIDNAVGFSSLGGRVAITLAASDEGYILSVANTGPLLPESMRAQLFDSLVSLRPKKGDRPHLGLGLYVAALVARFHGARIAADNLADGSGVQIAVVFPRAVG